MLASSRLLVKYLIIYCVCVQENCLSVVTSVAGNNEKWVYSAVSSNDGRDIVALASLVQLSSFYHLFLGGNCKLSH